ncbi:hypothetical protein FRC07_013291 [Ceratobasidium sp. 392]|nr:hypothetical protein FRC07_013291 [Ceratobasidium sp. 392]
MSDEYGANSNKNNTLVDDTALELNKGVGNVDNHPSDPSDSAFALPTPSARISLFVLATGSGGYGGSGDSFSDRSQRGLVDQSLDPGQFGKSSSSGSKSGAQATEHRDPLNPYGESGPGTPDNGEWKSTSDNDASGVADRRNEQWESKDGSGNDIGA